MNIEHNDERVNGDNGNVNEIPQNMESDEEADGINWNALPTRIWQSILRFFFLLRDFTCDKHACFTFNELCKIF